MRGLLTRNVCWTLAGILSFALAGSSTRHALSAPAVPVSFSSAAYLIRLKRELPDSYNDFLEGNLDLFEHPATIRWNGPTQPLLGYPANGNARPDAKYSTIVKGTSYYVVGMRSSDPADTLSRHKGKTFLGILTTQGKILWVETQPDNSSFALLADVPQDDPEKSTVGDAQPVPRKAKVILTRSSNCRTTPNWIGKKNIRKGSGVPAGSEGEVLQTHPAGSKNPIGYLIQVGNHSCWIHHSSVTTLSPPVIKPPPVAPRVCTPPAPLNPAQSKQVAQTQAIMETTIQDKDPRCGKPDSKCDGSLVPKGDPRRKRYDAEIAAAAERTGVPAGMIKAQVAAETSFRSPMTENKKERDDYLAGTYDPKYEHYKWGRGLGQFGADYAPLYGLAWYQSIDEILLVNPELQSLYDKNRAAFEERRLRDKLFVPGDKTYINGVEVTCKSVFDAKAVIDAKADMLRNNLRRTYETTVRNSEGKKQPVDVALVMPPVERLRLAPAAYNRGPYRVSQSIRAFTIAHSRAAKDSQGRPITIDPIPRTYLDIATTNLTKEQRAANAITGDHLLINHPIGKCHVWKIIRFCGEAGGFFQEYNQDFPERLRGLRV